MQEMGRHRTGKALNILKLQCLLENIKAADPNPGLGHTITVRKILQGSNAEEGLCYYTQCYIYINIRKA